MTRFTVCVAIFGIALWACDVVETPTTEGDTSTTEQATQRKQGRELQGRELQGRELQGRELQGMSLSGATLSSDSLSHVRVQKGELIADRPDGSTVRGTALAGTHLRGQVQDTTVDPPTTIFVDYRITAVTPESSNNDPTGTGHTFLYTLEQWVTDTGTWEPACDPDDDGRQVAIPVAAIWNTHGDRVESSSLFTFGCTTGVIAKCYRWGYRPWLNGYGDSMVAMHQTCTRLARADYCGNGVPGTRDGTKINVWDRLPSPGPIQRHGGLLGLPLPPPGMLFEAGWNTDGAVCLSTARWLLEDGIGLIRVCPDKLVPPGLLLPTVCDTVTQVFLFDTNARMLNESLNL